MKKDNLFINYVEAFTKRAFTGTISHNEEIVKLQNSNDMERQLYLEHLFMPLFVDPMKYCPIYTHCGRFHADEVFSTALILLVRNSIANDGACKAINFKPLNYINSEQIKTSVKRVKSIADVVDPLNECVVLDLLDGHYDHHHKNQDERKDYPDIFDDTQKEEWSKPVKMATFGALWSDIGYIFNLIGVEAPNKNVYELILMRFILPMDQQDNYGPTYYESPISKVISNMNSYSDFENFENETSEELDFRFIEAVKMAYTILRNEIMAMQRMVQSVKDIKENKYISLRHFGYKNGYSIAGVEIAKVGDGETVPVVMIDAVNETVIERDKYERDVHPLFIINHNPDQRDGAYRIVLGRYVKLDPKKTLETCGDLIKFIHPNGGFLISFETEEKMEKFLKEYFEYLIEFE